jgi:2-oxoglutarate dehydrogenase E1 component
MSFLDNVTPQWLEEHYLRWQQSPESLSPHWSAFFTGFEAGTSAPVAAEFGQASATKLAAVQALIHRHRDLGHLLACTNPLAPCHTDHPLLAPAAFGLDRSDLEREFPTDDFPVACATLGEIIHILRETYCRSLGVEFMHIQEPRRWHWLVERMEQTRNRTVFSPEEQQAILEKLLEATLFETYLHRKFPGQTRFSLEGAETVIPMLDAVVHHAAAQGVTDVILGMSHRGRLNIQAHIFGKPYAALFAEFLETDGNGMIGDGDVKYHSGITTERQLATGKRLHLTMVANPSHLEAVNPVVAGKCRARQDRCGEAGGARVLPVLLHGDAAFAGQGIVAETLNLSLLTGYSTGGTLHLVINNQIGFTTLPVDARSSCYATDVAKMLMAPIFHVHCEDPEAAIHAIRLALDYRQEFAGDVVVELICYRRHGHNEGDEPYFTQPVMYEKIKERPAIHQIYREQLHAAGRGLAEETACHTAISNRLETAFAHPAAVPDNSFTGRWSTYREQQPAAKIETGVAAETLLALSATGSTLPDNCTPHRKIAQLLAKRHNAVRQGEGLDWANAESLAFASLLNEGVAIRLSGQDCRRGTFSQRHCVIFDSSGTSSAPLSASATGSAVFRPHDSPLSEAAVLGFEYGYSLETPDGLTLWEAQYGDFANGAQVIIDQFIASGESKWNRASGLVLLLPHGYEGQGAEHSSARIERFLQLCADGNLQLAYPSTPGQYFHLLRRQVHQSFRKPLVVLTPKSLLRSPACVSRLDDLATGWFQEIYPSSAAPDTTTTVLICSGKIYHELAEQRARLQRDDTAIIRIEQLYPLRDDLLRQELGRFRKAERFAWVQEEPCNMGAWQYLRPLLGELLGSEPCYVGRMASIAPAVGSYRQHRQEQERLLTEAFTP